MCDSIDRKWKIYFELEDGSIDFIIVEGTINAVQNIAKQEVTKRNAVDAWSEEIK